RKKFTLVLSTSWLAAHISVRFPYFLVHSFAVLPHSPPNCSFCLWINKQQRSEMRKNQVIKIMYKYKP
ncbi:hypothetical protein XELAEV_18006225mg, partial [Xenopus laevis]